MPTTARYKFPYPLPTDAVQIGPANFQALAERIEAVVGFASRVGFPFQFPWANAGGGTSPGMVQVSSTGLVLISGTIKTSAATAANAAVGTANGLPWPIDNARHTFYAMNLFGNAVTRMDLNPNGQLIIIPTTAINDTFAIDFQVYQSTLVTPTLVAAFLAQMDPELLPDDLAELVGE